MGGSALIFGAALSGTRTRAFAAEPRHGGTLTLLLAAEPPVITTIAHTAFNSVFLSAKANEGLLTYDYDLTPRPQLATEWTISDNGLEYSFKLRHGVKWHDGKEFTSADVAYSIATIKEAHPRGRSTFLNLVDIRTPDPHSVTLVLSKPAPYLISALASAETPIVAQHLYEGTKAAENPVNNAPIGTGPFVFKEWVRGSHITYERNPEYWDNPKPYVDRLVIRFIPDATSRALAIETGEVDLAPATPIPFSDLERFETLPNIGFETQGYQYANGISRVEFNLDKPYFQDVRVRRAFAHVIDRNVIRDTINYGFGKTIPGPISPSLTKFYVGDLKTYAIDTATAEKLLDEAGLPGAVTASGCGSPTTMSRVEKPTSAEPNISNRHWQPSALKATVRSQDFATYTKRVYTDRDFDFTFNGMSNLFDPTVGVQRLYWSNNFKPGVPFSNGSHYSNPKVDALLEAAAVELDPQKRIEQFAAFQRILVEDLPDIGIVSQPEITLFNKRLAASTVEPKASPEILPTLHIVS